MLHTNNKVVVAKCCWTTGKHWTKSPPPLQSEDFRRLLLLPVLWMYFILTWSELIFITRLYILYQYVTLLRLLLPCRTSPEDSCCYETTSMWEWAVCWLCLFLFTSCLVTKFKLQLEVREKLNPFFSALLYKGGQAACVKNILKYRSYEYTACVIYSTHDLEHACCIADVLYKHVYMYFFSFFHNSHCVAISTTIIK